MTRANVILAVGLHTVYDRAGWTDLKLQLADEPAAGFGSRLASVHLPSSRKRQGVKIRSWQSDYEVAREAGASPDPSWHSDSNESDATNTTTSTHRRGRSIRTQRHESGRSTKPWPYDFPTHRIEPVPETTTYAGCKDGTTPRLGASKVARDGWRSASWTQTLVDGVWEKGEWWSLDEQAPKFGSRLRMEELHRLRELAEGKSQCAKQTLVEKKFRYQLHPSRSFASPTWPTLILRTVNAPAQL